MCTCGKNNCNGRCGASSLMEIQNQIDALMGYVDNLTALTKFLKGHPILALEDAADMSQFDFSTGVGLGDWIGWGICNGSNYSGASGSVATPDLRDRFLVGSQGTYSVGDVGGANDVTLTIAQIPSHNHTLTDPGHTHIVVDPGHDHNVTDPGHDHAATAANHQHTFTTFPAGDHNHGYDKFDVAGTDYYIPELLAPHQIDFSLTTGTTSTDGSHTHDGLTDMAVTAITVNAAFTGIDMDLGYTGISNTPNTTGITIDNEGGGLAHENRPPYMAVLFVKKIF